MSLISNEIDFQTPILRWLEKRALYVKNAGNWEWVRRDPIVSHLAPAMFLLDKKGKTHLPNKTHHEFAQIYWSNKASWVVKENHLKQVLNLFNQAEIPVILLKGAAFQGLLYKDIGLRSMSDIDLLVHPSTFLQAADLLIQNGWRLFQIGNSESLAEIVALPEKFRPGELIFHYGHELVIELHRNLVTYHWFETAYPLDVIAVWERRLILSDGKQLHKLFGDGIYKMILSPYDILAHLCLHLALHGMKAIKSYLDIDLWIQNLPADWDWNRFVEIVDQWQIRSAVYHSFSYCQDFMDMPLPEGLLKRLDPGWLARFRVKILISSQSILANRPSLGKRYPTLVKLALIDRLPSIMVTLIKLAFPDKAWREHNPSGRGLLRHWLHVLQVVKRGD